MPGRLLHCSIAALLLLTAVPATAQQYGSLYGAVTDETGSMLPGATVTLSGIGAEHLTVADERGEFRFLALDPGTYKVSATLDGFSTVEHPSVAVALNRNASIVFELSSAIEDRIVVTAQNPLLGARNFTRGTVVSEVELETIPTAREPWSLLNQTPGVQVGSVNVGGSESGQQPLFIGLGNSMRDNDYMMDGIQITDMSGIGFSATYYDFEQFEAVEISTGGTDVSKNTGGVSINMVTRRGTNEFRGSARFLSARADGLGFLGASSTGVDCSDLHPDQDCGDFTTNGVVQNDEYGFEAGGAAIQDRLWFWGSYGVQDINQVEAGGAEKSTDIESISVKANLQITPSNSAVASWNNGNKKVDNVFAGPEVAPEAALNQRGPSAFWRFEDTHVFSSNFFVTGSYQKSDLGFQRVPVTRCDGTCPLQQEALWDSDGVWRQNFQSLHTRRPEEAIKIDGSYFFGSTKVSHELKFGGRVRESTGTSDQAWPGRNLVHIAGENFGENPGPVDFFFLYRGRNDLGIDVRYNSLWIQDTLSAGRWTVNVGARWDQQDGVNNPGATGTSAVGDILPEIVFSEPVKPPFDWETVTPRIGLTYALGSERDTILRTSFSQFPGALGTTQVGWNNPATPGGSGSYAYFLFFDGPEDDNLWAGDEPYIFLFGAGYDPENPTSNFNTIEEDLQPSMTTEAILGIEHAILPEFVVGLDYTWREIDDLLGVRDNVRSPGEPQPGRPSTADDFFFDGTLEVELPDGSISIVDTWASDPSVVPTGFSHLENDTRSRTYRGLSLTANKRLANDWAMRGYVNWSDTEWNVPQSYLDRSDPNASFAGDDVDGASYLPGTNSRGTGRRFVQASWQANLNGLYQVALDRPWGFTVAANLYAREGYPLPYETRTRGSDGNVRTISALNGDTTRFRLPNLLSTDLSLQKEFNASSNVGLNLMLDLFNVFNDATPLSRQTSLTAGNADYLLNVVSPRIWRVGVRVSWR